MRIYRRERGGVTVLDLDGALALGEGDITLREEILQLLARGEDRILLNMRQVRSMDSSGLGELVAGKTAASARGSEIKLLHLGGKVRRVVSMTQLIGIFETFDDEIEAIASFDNT